VNVPGASDGSGVRGGGGFKLRAGEQFRFAHIRFTPEVGYGYDHLWATDDSGNERGWDMNRLFVGARISFGRFIVPVFYAHVGYGWRQDSNPSVDGTGGVAYDVGGALDFRIIPRVGFGVHLEYAAIDIPTQPQWVAIGGHADFLF
jgi:hypothetical protein